MKYVAWSLVAAVFLTIMIEGVVFFENSQLDGFYTFISRNNEKATLSIKDKKYYICFRSCGYGAVRLFDDGTGGKYIQFQNAGMLDFGKAIDAPLDPDVDGKITAVRLGLDRNLFGTIITNEDPDQGEYKYFQRIPFKAANLNENAGKNVDIEN